MLYNPPMKIIIGSWNFPKQSGPTVAIKNYVSIFEKKGIDIRVISPSKEKDIPQHYPVKPSLALNTASSILKIDEIGGFSPLAEREIKRICDYFNPDIYWSQMIFLTEDSFERVMCNSSKKKVVSIHSLGEDIAKDYTKKMLEKTLTPIGASKTNRIIQKNIEKVATKQIKKRIRTVSKKIDAFIVPTNFVKKRLLEYGVKTKIYVVPTGVDKPQKPLSKRGLRKKFGIPEKTKVVMYAGRIAKEKNVDILVKAIARMKRNDVYLLIIGEGNKEEISKIAKKEKVEKRIIFGGELEREELLNCYSGADVFVFASSTETQGLVIWESMIAGTPVVVNRLPIQKDVYPRGTAISVRKIHPEHYAKAIQNVLKNEKLRKKITKKAHNFVSKHTTEKTVEDLIKIFKNL